MDPLAAPLIRMSAFGASGASSLVLHRDLSIGVFVHSFPAGSTFLAAVSLAVAAIPEGLPAIMTITLSIGVQRMAGRHAIIRHLPAVDTLGAVTTICSDKTGTLTRNEMTARSVHLPDQRFTAEGVGYAPRGQLHLDGEAVGSPADIPPCWPFLRPGSCATTRSSGRTRGNGTLTATRRRARSSCWRRRPDSTPRPCRKPTPGLTPFPLNRSTATWPR